MSIAQKEADKYSKVWAFPQYHAHSPGAGHVPRFLEISGARPGDKVIDVGCGAGAATVELMRRDLRVTPFDLTNENWPFANIEVFTGSIWHGLPREHDFAFCCDVMEHIPTEFVALSIEQILRSAPKAFFSISFVDDVMGALIGEPLHLTVKPFLWWRDLLRELGAVEEARDLIGEGVFYVKRRGH